MANLSSFPDNLRKKLESEGLHDPEEIRVFLDEMENVGQASEVPFSRTEFARIRSILKLIPRQTPKRTVVVPLRNWFYITCCPHCGKHFRNNRPSVYWDHQSECPRGEIKAEYLAVSTVSKILSFCKATGFAIDNPVILTAIQMRLDRLTKGAPSISDLLDIIDLPWELRCQIPDFKPRLTVAMSGKSKVSPATKAKKQRKRANEFLTAVIILGVPALLQDECEELLTDPALNGGLPSTEIAMWRKKLTTARMRFEPLAISPNDEQTNPLTSSTMPEIPVILSADVMTALQSVANLFLDRARAQASFTPSGNFRVQIPYLLSRSLGLDEITVDVTVLTQNLNTIIHCLPTQPFNFSWSPAYKWVPGDHPFKLFIHAVLAAIWHDLRVAGEEMPGIWHINAANTSSAHPLDCNGSHVPGSGSIHPLSSGRNPTALYLPRIRSRKGAPHAPSTTPAKRDIGRKTTSWVSGHLMLLRPGNIASKAALMRAEADGVLVPDGMTYRRPYIRGMGLFTPEAHSIKPTGFNTLAVIFRKENWVRCGRRRPKLKSGANVLLAETNGEMTGS